MGAKREVYRVCFYFEKENFIITNMEKYDDDQDAINNTIGKIYNYREKFGKIKYVEIVNFMDYLNLEIEPFNNEYYIEKDLGVKKILIKAKE